MTANQIIWLFQGVIRTAALYSDRICFKRLIASGSILVIPNATLYHFGVLTSSMHMAWMRSVCGRLKSDYQYSNSIVYNNFPWPQAPTDKQKQAIEAAAQGVLEARAHIRMPPLPTFTTP